MSCFEIINTKKFLFPFGKRSLNYFPPPQELVIYILVSILELKQFHYLLVLTMRNFFSFLWSSIYF